MRKYGQADPSLTYPCDELQRIAEGQSFDVRMHLRKYESLVEAQRLAVAGRRQQALTGEGTTSSETERVVTLTTIDDHWADYLAAAGELRSGTIWLSLGGAQPFSDYVRRIHAMFQEFEATLAAELPARVAAAATTGIDPRHRGATWTYLTTDEPFGSMTERALKNLARRLRG
jgi:preprotein translocase subunit SecA